MNEKKSLFAYDLIRISGSDVGAFKKVMLLIKHPELRYLWHWRNSKRRGVIGFLHKIGMLRLYSKTGLELNSTNIGPGVLLVHPFSITINKNAIIGRNLTILKGATVGSIKGNGKKSGTPTIGDNVYIGLNSTIVGGITIGDDVLVAANSFVNFDVPSNSIVMGNPAVIHEKINAAVEYITNPISLENKYESGEK